MMPDIKIFLKDDTGICMVNNIIFYMFLVSRIIRENIVITKY
jgi:hypothetical protein